MEVIDIVDGGNVGSQLLLIDVRSEGEVGVSCLPGALHVPVHQDPGSALGWWVQHCMLCTIRHT
jgi:hypothetical protein